MKYIILRRSANEENSQILTTDKPCQFDTYDDAVEAAKKYAETIPQWEYIVCRALSASRYLCPKPFVETTIFPL